MGNFYIDKLYSDLTQFSIWILYKSAFPRYRTFEVLIVNIIIPLVFIAKFYL